MQNIGSFLSDDESYPKHQPRQHPKTSIPPWLPMSLGVAGVVVLLLVMGVLLVQTDVIGGGLRTIGGIFSGPAETAEEKSDPIAAALPASLGDPGTGELSGYSAVFLTNKQVYFGKLSGYETGQPVLEDVYYLRAQPRLQESSTLEESDDATEDDGAGVVAGAASDMTLIKLGNELHGPEDAIQLNRDHILFVERLREDSKVVQAILDYKSKQ